MCAVESVMLSEGHTKVNRGKSYSTPSSYRLQITLSGHEASIVARATGTADPPVDCKSHCEGHAKESRRPEASIVARATAEHGIDCKYCKSQ